MLFAISRVAARDFAEKREKGLQPHIDIFAPEKHPGHIGATTSDDGKRSSQLADRQREDSRRSAAFVDGDPLRRPACHERDDHAHEQGAVESAGGGGWPDEAEG